MSKLSGKKIAIITENGFEQVELTSPKKALEEAGAKVDVVSPEKGKVKAWDHDHWGIEVPVDVELKDASPNNYDGLLIPGGVMNPDKMRMNPDCVAFAQQFIDSGKPVAAICHGPWLLVEADVLHGRTITSWPSLKTDILNAGGKWVDQEVVTDQGLVTSRKPDDIPAFNKKVIEEIGEGKHRGQHA